MWIFLLRVLAMKCQTCQTGLDPVAQHPFFPLEKKYLICPDKLCPAKLFVEWKP
jgi:hypothetical protein